MINNNVSSIESNIDIVGSIVTQQKDPELMIKIDQYLDKFAYDKPGIDEAFEEVKSMTIKLLDNRYAK